MASVTFSDLGVTYPDGSTGLHGIDLDVAEGELLALVGPSGSGKTTLLRTLAGFIRPTSGEVRLGEETVASPRQHVPVERRGLGMVFQQHAVWPHMTVAQNIAYPLRFAGVSRAERNARVAQTLRLVGLEEHGTRHPAQLSGGQRQRVALGRAIIARPRVLLLDEALSALDEPLRAELRTQLQAMSKELGLTVVHVTHDRTEALAIADRIAVLESGSLRQVDTPDVLLRHPASAFVAHFLTDATLIPGELGLNGFRSDDPAIHVPRERITLAGAETGGARSGVLAVRPEQLAVGMAGEGGTIARVRSSLFGRHTCTAQLEWAGMTVTGETGSWRPHPGSAVEVDVRAGVFYRSQPAPMSGATRTT